MQTINGLYKPKCHIYEIYKSAILRQTQKWGYGGVGVRVGSISATWLFISPYSITHIWWLIFRSAFLLSYIQIFFANFAKNGQKCQNQLKKAKNAQILSKLVTVNFKMEYLNEFWSPPEIKSSGKILVSMFLENKKKFGLRKPQMNIYKFIAFLMSQKRHFFAFWRCQKWLSEL